MNRFCILLTVLLMGDEKADLSVTLSCFEATFHVLRPGNSGSDTWGLM